MEGNIYAGTMKRQAIWNWVLGSLAAIFALTSLGIWGAYRDQKSRADSFERARYDTNWNGASRDRAVSTNSEAVASKRFTEPKEVQIRYAKMGHMALARCHKKNVVNSANILLESTKHCPLDSILRGLSLREVNKYVAQEAFIMCKHGQCSKYAKRLLDCVYTYNVPYGKIAEGLNREKMIEFLSQGSDEEYKRSLEAKSVAEQVMPYRVDLDKLPQLPACSKELAIPNIVAVPANSNRPAKDEYAERNDNADKIIVNTTVKDIPPEGGEPISNTDTDQNIEARSDQQVESGTSSPIIWPLAFPWMNKANSAGGTILPFTPLLLPLSNPPKDSIDPGCLKEEDTERNDAGGCINAAP